MNKLIENQIKYLNLQMQKISDTEYFIPQQAPPAELTLQVGHYYIIQLADYILHPFVGFTLQDKWNNGVIPKSNYLKCVIKRQMGAMFQIDGCGYNYSDDLDIGTECYYDLWLPEGGITIITEI